MPWAAIAWPGLVLVSYFIGSMPTAYLATRLLKGQDIRQLGDRNVGAANVYRSVGPRAGLAVGIIDIAKGAVAVLLVKGMVDSPALEMTEIQTRLLARVVTGEMNTYPVFTTR